jgi:hypothetical protein
VEELSLHILDICQNSIKANATLIQILIDENTKTNSFVIEIVDDGHGMNKETLTQVSDPFFTTRTTRKVGLGISLFKMAAESTNGTLKIESKEHHGTKIIATFDLDHIDRAPLGEIEDTLVILALNEENIDIFYRHRYNEREFIFDTRQIREILEETPFTAQGVTQWMKEYIKEGLYNIHKEEAK